MKHSTSKIWKINLNGEEATTIMRQWDIAGVAGCWP